ncbi:MAG: D-tyrosyl-tRNA(Tyr) deacylase [Acidobacteria bacterium]|nr:D-tyrosyl-tRNA(Tyr) deacylase [Acidobacteriota bacterium]
MILVIQRVRNSKVVVEEQTVGEIGGGILILLGVEKNDGEEEVKYCARKAVELRIFPDEEQKMNLSLLETGGEALIVSQFTLAGKVAKGRRPSFDNAMVGAEAEKLYEDFVNEIKSYSIKTATGTFAAMMDVHLINDGPVTFIVESRNRK